MLLLVCAIEEEVQLLYTKLNVQKIADKLWQTEDKQVIIACGGVGYLDMALRLSEIGNIYSIHKILFCGTAGLYPFTKWNWETIGLIQAKDVCLFDTAAILKKSVYAQFLNVSTLASTLILPDISSLSVGTTLSLTVDTTTAKRIADIYKIQAETMELYAVAKYAKRNNINWGALLGITNLVGEESHFLWKKNAPKIYTLLATWLSSHWQKIIT